MFKNILVVCSGNICRSPVAAALLRKRLPDRQVDCAGLTALVDSGPDATALELARTHGLDIDAHRARQLTEEMVQWADLILVMSGQQRRELGRFAPQALGKTMLFARWLEGPADGLEIPDPYRKDKGTFIHVHELLTRAADTWKCRLG